MSNKKNDLKINLDSLLHSYSVKDITGLFVRADNKLMSLHTRSAEDFLKLNDDFKNIYKQSDEITNTVVQLLNEFSNQNNDNFYQILYVIYEKLKAQREIIDYKIIVILDQLEKLVNQIRHAFFPIKNYNQNLVAVKYLLANFKVSLTYKTDEINNPERTYASIEKQIDIIKKSSEGISDTLNDFLKKVKSTQNELKNLTNQGEINLDDLLNNIHSSISLIERKSIENEKETPDIKECISKLQNSNSEIIKKLQYQDIIKQKMDHIQASHKDLIKELDDFGDPQDDSDNLTEKVKCFLRIRDISGLQAAQLMQANKEYQSAMEVITDNFIRIGDSAKEITDKSERMYSFDKVDYNKMSEKIDSYVHGANLYINDYDNQMSSLENEVGNIHKEFLEIGFSVNNHRKYTQSLEKSLDHFNKFIDQQELTEPELNKVNQQFKELLTQIEADKDKLNSFFDQIISLKSTIESFAAKTDKTLLGDVDFTELKSILLSLKKKGLTIENAMVQNKVNSEKMIEDIKTSISNINYYDYFENTILEIIADLNSVNLKLKLNKEHNEISKEENLEIIKQYYTIETERDIHAKVTNGEDLNISFDIKEDDDIEFF